MYSRVRQLVMKHFKVCPKTGKIVGIEKVRNKSLFLWVTLGIASIVWVLLRVVPKPDRAAYPCQQVAQPIAAGFIAWLVGLIASTLIVRKARHFFKGQQYWLSAGLFVAGAFVYWLTLSDTPDATAEVIDIKATEQFTPSDDPNTPVGVGKGIHPGRVVWVYDSKLCDQKSNTGWWWEDDRTDPETAQNMVMQALTNLTGIEDVEEAWDALFKNFNQTRYGESNTGYQAGDKIAIKVNNIFSRTYEWTSSQNNRPSPQMLHAVLWQLVNKAGVPEKDITIYDCIFYHGDPVYNYNHAVFPGVRWAEGDATDRSGYEGGPGDNPETREKVVLDTECMIHYGDTNIIPGSGTVGLPTVVTEAKYLMNIALPRPHELAGVTACAKNFFGSIHHPTVYSSYYGWQPEFMHKSVAAVNFSRDITMRPMGSYNALVDLMGHKELGGKTMLLMVECLRYNYWSSAPFNGGPASSFFMSQDFVAIESVMLDFLRSEGAIEAGTPDNYMHEAAQADNPPSGTVYDPENDGTPLESLGVHEHWNNSTDKQYSRNMGADEGIELLQVIDRVLINDIQEDVNSTEKAGTLHAGYPNPFRYSTTVCCSLQEAADVSIDIFNLKGEKINTLVNGTQQAGILEVTWDGSGHNGNRAIPGIYICKMTVKTNGNAFSQSQRLVLTD